jgi:hypothetical protein
MGVLVGGVLVNYWAFGSKNGEQGEIKKPLELNRIR